MEAIYYLLMSMIVGFTIASKILKNSFEKNENTIWYMIFASFGIGTLIVTWMVYIISYIFSVFFKSEEPLFWGNLIVLVGITIIGVIVFWNSKKKKDNNFFIESSFIVSKEKLKKEIIFYSILGAFIAFTMFYVFFVKDGIMYSGYTVYSDYAPHTAMIRSFSMGNNFPTQYPHFGGEDVKYHFMFQFLVGNLEYLGMRIDFAYNFVSIISLWGFLILLSRICIKMSGSLWAGVFASICFMFRSGTTFFQFLYEHIKAGDLINALKENTVFIGYTPNENWGFWNYNVYLNQRHLAFGLLIAAILIIIFYEWLECGTSHEEKGIKWIGQRLVSIEAWKSRNIKKAIVCGIILGLCSFWNGAVVIGTLLILAGFAVFSDGKIDYAIMAGITVLLSQLQSMFFVDGSVMNLRYQWGFICEDKSLLGVIIYLIQITGISILGLLILAICMNRIKRCLIFATCIPVIFTFTISLTPDIAVNHKYIMIACAFMTVFWGEVLYRLFSGKAIKKIVALILIICLTATGIYDFVIIIRGNSDYRKVTVNLEDNTLRWLENTLTKNDLVVSPEYSMSEVTMSGAMLYYGWPYYAWSAGYDTNYRSDIVRKIYNTQDSTELIECIAQEKITYIIFEEGMKFEDVECREDIIKKTYPLAMTSDNGRIRIYKTETILGY